MFVLVYVVTYEVSKDYSLALLYTALWFAVGKDYANDNEEDEEEEEDEQDEGGPGWSAMASMCKPSTSLGRREEKWGEEDQGLNFRSSLGYFPLYSSRSISIG